MKEQSVQCTLLYVQDGSIFLQIVVYDLKLVSIHQNKVNKSNSTSVTVCSKLTIFFSVAPTKPILEKEFDTKMWVERKNYVLPRIGTQYLLAVNLWFAFCGFD